MMSRGRYKQNLVLLAIAAVIFAGTVVHQRWLYKDWKQGSGKYIQKIYLPNVEIIRVAALGYDNLYADFLTLRAVQMFGAAWETETGEVTPIYDYFDILTTLDPHFVDVYDLAHLVISDAHGEHDLALELLRKGIAKNPREWRISYLGLYTALWNMQDARTAREFLHYARRTPDAPEHVLRMEEYIERQSGRYHAAFDVNLAKYLQYLDHDMEHERNVTFEKFRTIIHEWNLLELARAAEKFHEGKGRHPESIEEMLAEEEYLPRFQTPTMPEVVHQIALAAMNYHVTTGLYSDDARNLVQEVEFLMQRDLLSPQLQGEVMQVVAQLAGRLSDYRETIRENSFRDQAGLPAEPFGSWYFIDPTTLEETRDTPDDPDKPLVERFPYFQSAQAQMEIFGFASQGIQRYVLDFQRDTGEYPTHELMANYVGYDGFGGHWVYVAPEDTPDGYPRFFTTAQLRDLDKSDPRRGLQGTLENFPPRPVVLTDKLPPYLTTFPSIWDFPEDIEWALCIGLEPGILFVEQEEHLRRRAREESAQYLHCNEHIRLPETRDTAAQAPAAGE